MPLADPVVLGEGPCVAWGNLLMPGSSSPTCVLVFLAVLKGRGVLRSSVPDGKARRVFRGRGRRGQVGCVTQPFVEGGTGSLVVRQTARRAQRIVRRCSSVQDWDGDGTGPSLERGSAVDQGHVVGNRRGGGAGLAVVVRQTNEAPGCPGQSRNAERGKGRDEPLKMYVGRKNGGPKV